MRITLVLALLFVATAARGAEDGVKASGRLEGKKVRFPKKGVAQGVKATVALLESCTSSAQDSNLYTVADVQKALRGDHVRLEFARPITVRVGGGRFEVSELVFTQPLNTGVFWLRSGDKVVRCSKYRVEKEKPFLAWRNEARATR
jgi:hypothetical protein